MDVKEIGYEDVYKIFIAEDMAQWFARMKKVMNFSLP
jgi:hypothetical protein